MKYIDTHSHIHDKAFDVYRDVLINSLKEKYIYTITIGTDYETSLAAKRLAEANENVYYTIGVHPHDNEKATFDENKFNKLLGDKCVAIGECGLDYFYLYKDINKNSNNINLNVEDNEDIKIIIEKEKSRQKDLFIKQIIFARENKLPLMLHGRPSEIDAINNVDGMDAYHDMIEILSSPTYQPSPLTPSRDSRSGTNTNSDESLSDSSPKLGALTVPNVLSEREIAKWGNVHFFVGNIDIAKKFIGLGFDFSLGGVLTITRDYDEMVKYLPVDRIHAETDSPYVVPRDNEGRRVSKINSPQNIEIIIERIAELKNITKGNLNSQLLINSKRLYRF